MRKSLAIVSALIALCSCAKTGNGADGKIVENQGEAITFGYLSTRAFSETTSDVIKNDATGFRVVGLSQTLGDSFNTDAKYFKDSQTSEEYYKTAEPYYYKSDTWDFYAVFPSKTLSVVDKSVSLDNYTSEGDEDVVAAVAKGKTSGRVNLEFNHILSRLSVVCIGSDTNVDYVLDSCKVFFNKKGSYSFEDALDNANWTADGTDSVKVYDKAVSTSERLEVLKDLAVVPGGLKIAMSWTCKEKASGLKIKAYENVINEQLAANIGKESTVVCKLKNGGATPITFEIIVNPWDQEEQIIDFGD